MVNSSPIYQKKQLTRDLAHDSNYAVSEKLVTKPNSTFVIVKLVSLFQPVYPFQITRGDDHRSKVVNVPAYINVFPAVG